jgi:hypothetical protein
MKQRILLVLNFITFSRILNMATAPVCLILGAYLYASSETKTVAYFMFFAGTIALAKALFYQKMNDRK